jgi:hypothetical protein
MCDKRLKSPGVVVDSVADRVVSTDRRSENEALYAAALSERGYKDDKG